MLRISGFIAACGLALIASRGPAVGVPPAQAARTADGGWTVAMERRSDRPSIHTAGLIGINSATPVYIQIAASGMRPMRYAVRRLPRGLALDRETGLITGTAPGRGRYRFTVSAQNAKGRDTRTIRLIVGDSLALLPPLGWNSYDSYHTGITEVETIANARWLKERLQPYGWEYIVLDARWADPRAGGLKAPGFGMEIDQYGRLIPAVNRFPSAAGGAGFAPLAARLHAMGLKFGIHIMRGVARQAVDANPPIEGSSYHIADAVDRTSTCDWSNDMWGIRGETTAGKAWYESLIRQYAAWGVDYIKMDDASSPYHAAEIAAVHDAISRCGRSIVLSLSPGETPVESADHLKRNANLWRIADDFWDRWELLRDNFRLLAQWQGKGGSGHWPDADMIPLGHLGPRCPVTGSDRQTRLTRDEQVTLMTLWLIAPSPMMLGMNLPDNDDWTVALLTNEEALAVNQDPLAAQAQLVREDEGLSLWSKALADGSLAVGLFNLTSKEMEAPLRWSDIEISGTREVRDIWRRKSLGRYAERCDIALPPHGARFLRIAPEH